MSKDNLGDRIKSYEDCYRINLPIRMPIIVRLDGKSFHSYTKGCKKPIDDGLIECMNDTAIELCKKIQGCQLAYVQSDEISLLITNYKELNTQPWYDNNLIKMVSVSAAIASVCFTQNSHKIWGIDSYQSVSGDTHDYPIIKPAYFDSRAFVLPKEDVTNYFIWRQQDCIRNSVQTLARSIYSHKELHALKTSKLKEMCSAAGTNWDECPTFQKRGRCVIKYKTLRKGMNPKTGEKFEAETYKWDVDNDIPDFIQNREYIGNLV